MFPTHKPGMLRAAPYVIAPEAKKIYEEKGLLPFYEKYQRKAEELMADFHRHMEFYCACNDLELPTDDVLDKMKLDYVKLVDECYTTGNKIIPVASLYDQYLKPKKKNKHE